MYVCMYDFFFLMVSSLEVNIPIYLTAGCHNPPIRMWYIPESRECNNAYLDKLWLGGKNITDEATQILIESGQMNFENNGLVSGFVHDSVMCWSTWKDVSGHFPHWFTGVCWVTSFQCITRGMEDLSHCKNNVFELWLYNNTNLTRIMLSFWFVK